MLDMCPVNETVNLIVGTKSAAGGTARFEHTTLQGRANPRGVTLPLGAAAATAGTVAAGVPVVGIPDVLGGVVPDLNPGFERTRVAGRGASFTASVEGEGEQVFAVACRGIKRTWPGLGKDVRVVGTREPEYHGGEYFGLDSESDGEDGDGRGGGTGLNEMDEMALVEGEMVSQ